MSAPAALLANLGAEEGPVWRRHARVAAVREAAALWALLFPAGTSRLDPGESHAPPEWLGPCEAPALDALASAGGALVPWLATDEAHALARERGLRLFGGDAAVVREVHDKAFAVRHARAQGELESACGVLEPGDPESLARQTRAHVASWPEAWRERFALKPRLGTTGRGRIDATRGCVDPAALARAPSGAGFVVEPWVERVADASTQLWVEGPGRVEVLGHLQLEVAPSGRCIAFEPLDAEQAATALDLAKTRETAVAVAAEASHRGYTGPCSVDAFAWRDVTGIVRTRGVVELNARFSLGLAALGLFARARAAGVVPARLELRRPASRRAGLHLTGGWWLTPIR